MRIRVRAPVYPTEDPDSVMRAVSQIYVCRLDARVDEKGYGEVVGESSDPNCLLGLHRRIREQMIMDAARKYLARGRRGDRIVFMLHKQALYMGKLSFVDNESESPLGAVTVIIETPNTQEVIDWLAPKTRHGRPLWEKEPPPE